jgi:hypothetical protein
MDVGSDGLGQPLDPSVEILLYPVNRRDCPGYRFV